MYNQFWPISVFSPAYCCLTCLIIGAKTSQFANLGLAPLLLPAKYPTDAFRDARKAANIVGKPEKFEPALKRQVLLQNLQGLCELLTVEDLRLLNQNKQKRPTFMSNCG
jgi:hypothetical protein